jgi:signal peptidase I
MIKPTGLPQGYGRLVTPRKSWPVFSGKCLLALTVMIAGWWWFSSRYALGIAAGQPCMHGEVYLIRRQAPGEAKFKHGDLIEFRTDRRPAPYPPGSKFLKLVRGTPGDRVSIDPAGKVHITGQDYHFESALEPRVVKLLHKKYRDLAGQYTIPPGSYFVMGTLPGSYDSRYWGLVEQHQIIGKGLAVFGR